MKSGAKQKPISEDPKVQARRDKARLAYAMKKSESASMKSSLSSYKPMNVIPSIVDDEKIKKAKDVISRAVQMGKATGEMRKLQYEKKMKELQANAIKFLKLEGINTEGELMIPININFDDFKTYISQQYPEYWKFIFDTESKKPGSWAKDEHHNKAIPLIYKPYSSYDYFIYKTPDGKEYPMKISLSVDENYSEYLQNKYYRIPYTYYERSKGIFSTDVFQKKSMEETFPVPFIDDGKPPTMLHSNKKLVGERHTNFKTTWDILKEQEEQNKIFRKVKVKPAIKKSSGSGSGSGSGSSGSGSGSSSFISAWSSSSGSSSGSSMASSSLASSSSRSLGSSMRNSDSRKF